MNARPILLACDLDRTLLPNGDAPESPEARPLFRRLATHPELVLAYVTGRDRALTEQAIAHWDLPRPVWLVGDVGTSLYRAAGTGWTEESGWNEAIAVDWRGRSAAEVAAALAGIDGLRPQEAEKQGRHKASFTAPPLADPDPLLARVRRALDGTGLRHRLVWSIDEAAAAGLLDVLPASAGKLESLLHLARHLGIGLRHTMFAGDSGNDLDVLASPVPAVLVANASAPVRRAALDAAASNGTAGALYLARGGPFGLNGNYAAGVIEGLAHYHPEVTTWLTA
jgi:HAD superfamily hydrolase (TIGR01484 family)